MEEPQEELMFNKIRIDYPDLPNRPVSSLTVKKIEAVPGKNRIKVTAETEKGVKTILVLEKINNYFAEN